MANGRCRMHGGASPGAPLGNANALKHGRFTADAIAQRRELAALIRSMRRLIDEVDGQDLGPRQLHAVFSWRSWVLAGEAHHVASDWPTLLRIPPAARLDCNAINV